MKTLSKSKGVKEIPNSDIDTNIIRFLASDPYLKFFDNSEENEMPPTILDDDIADWEHDNLESK